ncbi:hypothetical protein KAT92_02760 [Candidatus Babeliales bacterium]|nr:hypothetical protein [Candidatus Babeliales bacterium]
MKIKSILLICSFFILGAPTICLSMDLATGIAPTKFTFVAANGKTVRAVTNPVLKEGSDNAHTCLLYSLYNVIVFEKLTKLAGCFTVIGDAKKSFPIIQNWKKLLKVNGWDGNSGLNGKHLLELTSHCEYLKSLLKEKELSELKELPASVTVLIFKDGKPEQQEPSLWSNIKCFRSKEHPSQTILVIHNMPSGGGHAYCVKLVWPENEKSPAMLIAETRLPDSFELNKEHAKLIFDLFTSTPIPPELT